MVFPGPYFSKEKILAGIEQTMEKREEAGEYHSKDFEWEFLKNIVENDPSLSHHLHHHHQNLSKYLPDSQPWQDFHSRHSSGKFFKVLHTHHYSISCNQLLSFTIEEKFELVVKICF